MTAITLSKDAFQVLSAKTCNNRQSWEVHLAQGLCSTALGMNLSFTLALTRHIDAISRKDETDWGTIGGECMGKRFTLMGVSMDADYHCRCHDCTLMCFIVAVVAC